MSTEPTLEQAAVDQPVEQPAEQTTEQAAEAAEATEGEQQAETKAEDPPKKDKTPEEREIARLRRRVDNLTRRLYQGQSLQQQPVDGTNRNQEADSEPLSLSRAELQRLVEQEAHKLAPTISEQRATIEHRQAVIAKLSSELGAERFDALAAELDDAFDGLKDQQGRPKPAADAIFEAEDPRALIEYLADPENAAEAAAISRMGPLQAGRAIARIEAKAAAKKAEQKPQPSKATAPIEPVKGGGAVSKPIWDLEGDDFDRARREQIAARRR